jgi:hypothetical protein
MSPKEIIFIADAQTRWTIKIALLDKRRTPRRPQVALTPGAASALVAALLGRKRKG